MGRTDKMYHDREEAIRYLVGQGAHMFRIRSAESKAPLYGYKWKDRRDDADTLIAHVRKGGVIAVIPASIGMVVFDVDVGGMHSAGAAKKITGMKAVWINSTRRYNGLHLWFPAHPGKINNRKWQNSKGKVIGDIRGSEGYVVLWNIIGVAHAVFEMGENPPKKRIKPGQLNVPISVTPDRRNRRRAKKLAV